MFVPELIPNPGGNPDLYDINWKQVMPRIGIAYRLLEKTVLRIGGGQYYNVNQINNFQILNLQPPLSGSNVLQNDRVNPQATIDKQFAGAAGQAPTALLMLGNVQSNGRSKFLNNDIWQWTAELERTFGNDLVFGVAYIGNKGSHLDQTVSNFNNPDPGPAAIQPRRPIQFYIDSLSPDVLRPLGTLRYLDSGRNSIYNALQVRAEKRYHPHQAAEDRRADPGDGAQGLDLHGIQLSLAGFVPAGLGEPALLKAQAKPQTLKIASTGATGSQNCALMALTGVCLLCHNGACFLPRPKTITISQLATNRIA